MHAGSVITHVLGGAERVLDFVVQIAFDAALYAWLGPKAFFYLLFSVFSAWGLHPLGARWFQEHDDGTDRRSRSRSFPR